MSKLPELIEKDGDVMAYSKTNWTEATPITADKLNQMEEGIANSFPQTGGVISGTLTVNNDVTLNANLNFKNQGKIILPCDSDEGHVEFNVTGGSSVGFYGNSGSVGIYDWSNRYSVFRYDRATKVVTSNGKVVPTFWSGTVDHNMIRYGAGLSGQNGYITFTW